MFSVGPLSQSRRVRHAASAILHAAMVTLQRGKSGRCWSTAALGAF
jgi:hypothetical protein